MAAINGGDPNHLLIGMILQEAPRVVKWLANIVVSIKIPKE